jgi:regulator of protease activity HflC (stomatin/prohibitin superfamily)
VPISHVKFLMSGCCCFTTISTSDVGVIERFGKFNRLANPGCVFVCCPYEIVSGEPDLYFLPRTNNNNI